MNETELRELLAHHHEADRVEFTIATRDTDKFAEAVCAFSNDLPRRGSTGYLIVGGDDAGRIKGVRVTDELLRNLAGLRDDGNIQPLPSLTVEKVITGDGDVAVVSVRPSPFPPVRYKGRVCIRIGPRRGYATEHEERLLIERRVAQAMTFDAQPCLGSAIDDLSLGLFLAEQYRRQLSGYKPAGEPSRPVGRELSIQTWPHPLYDWIMIPLEVGGDIVVDVVLSTYSPLSYVSERSRNTLVGLGFGESVGDEQCHLYNVSIQGQRIPDLSVRVRRNVVPTADGILGLDFLNQFTDIHFHVPTMRLTLTEA